MRKQEEHAMAGSRKRALALTASVVALAAVAPATVRAAGSTLVTAKVPAGQTVAMLRYQLFVQKVKCTRACETTTIVSIPLGDAQKLGYNGPTPAKPWVEVASNYTRLKANAVTEIRFVLNAQGKKLLPKAKHGLHIVGNVTAFPRGNPKAQSRVNWSAELK
jgi:hypothetical protein